MAPFNSASVEVALRCYGMIARLEESGASTEKVEAVEKALDMAIERRNSDKSADDLFVDVLANGRFSARRSRARQLRTAARCQTTQRRCRTGKRGQPGEIADVRSPQSAVEAKELLEELADEARRGGRQDLRILSGLIAGDTIKRTSVGADVSPATVNRTVKRLRSRAVDSGYAAAA